MAKRRKKLKKKLLLFFIIVLAVILIIFKYNNNNNNYLDKYSSESQKIIKNNNIKINKYSKTLDELLKSNNYKLEYIDEYININYLDSNNFLEYVNKYLEIGYNANEIDNIFKLSALNQEKILKYNKLDFKNYLNINNFNIDNIERYDEFKKNNDYELKDIVTYVNINLDKKYYTDTQEVKDPDNLLVLVNKYNYLPNNYKPSDLVYVDGAYGNKVPFREVLKESFINLQDAAKKEININLMPTTAFRNQSFQTTLYNNYVASDGKEKADTYSARPGYSEHQTGLAIDLKNMALSNTRLTDDNYNWLQENAYKYGFIIRFPKDKEFITGYQFENWHIRYVGKEVAKTIHDNNLTLEEYIDLYITRY